MTLAFITGLTAEARLLPYDVHIAGTDASRAAAAAIASGATALISFGLAGGLDPALAAGAMLRPASVIWRGQAFPTHAGLMAALGGITCAASLATDAAVATAEAKQAQFHRTGAAGVDMESGAVAEAAAQAGIAFGVMRAICDTAAENLPPAALAALDAAGKITILRVAHSVVRHPAQMPGLLALASHANAARKALATEIAGISARGALKPWL